MIVLVGEGTGKRWDARLAPLRWGRMFVQRAPRIYPGEPWGFDNGAYLDWVHGRVFSRDRFLRHLERSHRVGTPYLAVAPDIVGQGNRSLEFSLRWLDELPPWPWYLAVQDGMTPTSVRPHLTRFAGIFLGGTNPFKSMARHWRALATESGKRFHYGRAGTLGKLEHARLVGADSLDSAFPMWTTGRWRAFVEDWTHAPQYHFPETAAA